MRLQAKFATGTSAKKAAGIVEKLLGKQQFRGHGWTWTDTSLYEHEVSRPSPVRIDDLLTIRETRTSFPSFPLHRYFHHQACE